jgi:hypothetical protein
VDTAFAPDAITFGMLRAVRHRHGQGVRRGRAAGDGTTTPSSRLRREEPLKLGKPSVAWPVCCGLFGQTT